MTLSPLTHDAFGEVSVADAYVCRWASLRVPVRSGFDVMPAHGPQYPDVVVRPPRMPPLRKPFQKRTFYELVLYWCMKFHNAGLRTNGAWCCTSF